ncbi:hypothetical protein FO519_009140 [Halicephalobus sp. NKZ332]|nr:hypothetical protein FO519_009140 [Halicephalobus sp. NKZ332]
MSVIDIPQERMIQQALEFSPDLEPFTHDKTFIFTPKDVYGISAIMSLAVLAGFTTIFLVLMYLLKKELISQIRSEHQKNLIMSVIAQVTVTIPNSGPVIEVLEMLGISHTLVEYCVTLYFVAPYRRYVWMKFNTVKETLNRVLLKKDVMPPQSISIVYSNMCRDIQTFGSSRYVTDGQEVS